jgi:hypothetical protein
MSYELDLFGLEGSNPLAFLAALGTLRTLSLSWPNRLVRLSWRPVDGWRPALHFTTPTCADEVLGTLASRLSGAHDQLQFNAIGDDLTVAPSVFREFVQLAATVATTADRVAADFAAAFGCECIMTENADKPTIQDTALRTMAGAGHQHFLGFMRNVIRATQPEHLRKALFEPWRYDDPVTNLTLRWDPVDDVRYALRWRNPSGDPTRKSAGSVLGANRLAIEGLPWFPTAPQANGRLATRGFRGHRSTNTFWTWPIWERPATADTVRSLLALRELQEDRPPRGSLKSRGISEVFRSQRLTIGKVKNFTAGESV